MLLIASRENDEVIRRACAENGVRFCACAMVRIQVFGLRNSVEIGPFQRNAIVMYDEVSDIKFSIQAIILAYICSALSVFYLI